MPHLEVWETCWFEGLYPEKRKQIAHTSQTSLDPIDVLFDPSHEIILDYGRVLEEK